MTGVQTCALPISYIPLLIVLLNLTQTSLSYFSGIKIDKIGPGKMLLFSFVLGILSMVSLYFKFIIIGFILLGIFTVISLNAIRTYISIKAYNKGTVYGVLYGGVAISGALGAVSIGLIWKYFTEEKAFLFSIIGLIVITIFSLKIEHKSFI